MSRFRICASVCALGTLVPIALAEPVWQEKLREFKEAVPGRAKRAAEEVEAARKALHERVAEDPTTRAAAEGVATAARRVRAATGARMPDVKEQTGRAAERARTAAKGSVPVAVWRAAGDARATSTKAVEAAKATLSNARQFALEYNNADAETRRAMLLARYEKSQQEMAAWIEGIAGDDNQEELTNKITEARAAAQAWIESVDLKTTTQDAEEVLHEWAEHAAKLLEDPTAADMDEDNVIIRGARLKFRHRVLPMEGLVLAAADKEFADLLESSTLITSGPARARLVRVANDVLDQYALDTGERAWEVVLIDHPTLNAFAFPNYKVVVHSRLIDEMDDDMLASVLGHEIAHIYARHAADKVMLAAAAMGINLTMFLQLGLPPHLVAMILNVAVRLPYSRACESEADYIGQMMAARACYDPCASTRVMETLHRHAGSTPHEWLSTHGSHEARASSLHASLPDAMKEFATRCPLQCRRNVQCRAALERYARSNPTSEA